MAVAANLKSRNSKRSVRSSQGGYHSIPDKPKLHLGSERVAATQDIEVMATPGSSFSPTPLGHEDNLQVRQHPRANALQPVSIQTESLKYNDMGLIRGPNTLPDLFRVRTKSKILPLIRRIFREIHSTEAAITTPNQINNEDNILQKPSSTVSSRRISSCTSIRYVPKRTTPGSTPHNKSPEQVSTFAYVMPLKKEKRKKSSSNTIKALHLTHFFHLTYLSPIPTFGLCVCGVRDIGKEAAALPSVGQTNSWLLRRAKEKVLKRNDHAWKKKTLKRVCCFSSKDSNFQRKSI
ncbi:hypothetical protein TNCV_3808551 [Trichonephila clavipes]|nr:hypothetical protein TNCV_3808551 [Trichonephila clavipes]